MVKHPPPAKAKARPGKRAAAPKKAAPRRKNDAPVPSLIIERMQTGVRLEKRVLKVLKALAELRDLSLGDLIEGIVLHAFEGKAPFSPETLKKIGELKRIYGLDLDASASHRLRESEPEKRDR
jgi:hypothetical protein